MTRLRPEQVAGGLFQAASITTLGPQSHWFIRLTTYTGRNDFVRRYGDSGEDEFDARSGTIPQRLVLMNGEIVREKIKRRLVHRRRPDRRSCRRRPRGRRNRVPRRAHAAARRRKSSPTSPAARRRPRARSAKSG